MTQHLVDVSAHNEDDRAGGWKGCASAPAGDTARGNRIERSLVGCHDQAKREALLIVQPRPLSRRINPLCQLDGNRLGLRPKHSGDAPHSDQGRPLEGQRGEKQRYYRCGSSPRSTRSRTSLQRLPQMVSLFALCPLAQVSRAASRSSAYQCARPSS